MAGGWDLIGLEHLTRGSTVYSSTGPIGGQCSWAP